MDETDKIINLMGNINDAYNAIIDYIDVLSQHLTFKSKEVREEYLSKIIQNIFTYEEEGVTKVSVDKKDWNDMLLYKEFVIFVYNIRSIDKSMFTETCIFYTLNIIQFELFKKTNIIYLIMNNIPLDEFQLIGPLKKKEFIKFDNDELNITGFNDFYLDYDGFYEILNNNNFDFDKYININQNYQLEPFIKYFVENKEFSKSINIIKNRYDWLLNFYQSEEDYEECAKILETKNTFLKGIENLNNKYNSEYGK